MTGTHRLTAAEARRIAVRAQLLAADRPAGVLGAVQHLTMLQLDQTRRIAPSHDVVLFTRLGSSYDPEALPLARAEGSLVEMQLRLRPAEDVALYRADMATWPGEGELRPWQRELEDWVEANDACRRDLLARLRDGGPQAARALPDTCERPWRSSGWTNDRNVSRLLGLMEERGEVAVAGRRGRDRLWDLAERVYPDDPAVPADEAARARDALRLRALGIARPSGPEVPGEAATVGDAGEPAEVEGTPGAWRVDSVYLDGASFRGRAALLSPLDRLVFDRRRMEELFGFDYQLEMYRPAAGRRWGYWAMPVLVGDRLVGKLDATADRRAGVLRVHAVHEDEPWRTETASAVDAEIADLAAWLELDLVR